MMDHSEIRQASSLYMSRDKHASNSFEHSIWLVFHCAPTSYDDILNDLNLEFLKNLRNPSILLNDVIGSTKVSKTYQVLWSACVNNCWPNLGPVLALDIDRY